MPHAIVSVLVPADTPLPVALMVSTALWNVKVVPSVTLQSGGVSSNTFTGLPDHRVFVLRGDVGEVIAVGAALLLARDDAAVGLRALELAAAARSEQLDLVGRESPSGPFMCAFVGVGRLVLASS